MKKFGTTRCGRSPACRTALVAGAWLAGICIAGLAYGQQDPAAQAYLQQQREIEQQIRLQLGESLPPVQTWQFDAGAWQSFYLLDFDDSFRRRTQRRWDSRIWAAGTGDWGTHQFYARLKMTYLDWNAGDSYNGNEDDFDGPDADRLWYQFDLRQAVRTYGKSDLPFDLQTRVGRQYVEFGTGYALSLPLDAVMLTTRVNNLEVRGLISQTVRGMDDFVNPSRPDSTNTDRHMVGIETRYRGRQHSPFAYVFWNLDENPQPRWGGQQYGYDSVYAGIGSQGQLLPYLRYSTELVYEGGRSARAEGLSGRAPINAWAYDALLSYLVANRYQPIFDLEYMFASGDADRVGSPLDVIGGNTRGTDQSFVGFGFRNTGLALAPRLSNIHIWRAGASFVPFPQKGPLKRLRVGSDWFLYAKHKGAAAISDLGANDPSNFLGWEMDYYINWQITQELAATAQYGVFFPGDGFSQDETRTFFLLGMTYSF